MLRGCTVAAVLLAAAIPAAGQQPIIDPVLHRLMQPDLSAQVAAHGVVSPDQPPDMQPLGGTVSMDTDAMGRIRVAVFVELTSAGATAALDELRAAGAEIGSIVGAVAIVRVPLDALQLLLTLPVVRVQAARPLHLVHDSSMVAIGAHTVRQRTDAGWTGTTGAGALIGVIDTGLDITHVDFRDDAGNTRVAGVWDMVVGTQPPAGFGYGFHCTRAAVQAVVDGASLGVCPTGDLNGHGTHVAGSAAGNGAASQPLFEYAGVAPRAELLIVRAGNGTFTEDRVVDGAIWIRQEAQALGRPVVLNLSLGHQWGPHDGSLLFERMLDELSGPGFIVVAAAGNQGENLNTVQPVGTPPRLIHARVPATPGMPASTQFQITAYTPNPNLCIGNFVDFSVWFDVRDRIEITVVRPDGTQHTTPVGTWSYTDHPLGRIEIFNAFPLQAYPGTAEANITVSGCGESGAPAAGTWTITTRATAAMGAPAAPVDIYINGAILGPGGRAFGTTGFDNRFVMAAPGSAHRVVTVGAFTTRTCWPSRTQSGTTCYANPTAVGDIADFSSAGPTRDGRMKPEIAAPGVGVMSTLSSQAAAPAARTSPNGEYWVLEGSSMATPHVTGAVALMFEHRPGLSPEQVVDIFSRSARRDAFTQRTYGSFGGVPADWWGHGKLDVPAALAELLGGGSVAQLRIVPQVDTIPLGGARALVAEAVDDAGAVIFANLQWTSLDPGIATVTAFGVVQGVALGTARVVVRADALADTAVITVEPPATLIVRGRSAAPDAPVTGPEQTLLPLLAISLEARGPEAIRVHTLAFEMTGADADARLILLDDPAGTGEPDDAARTITSRVANLTATPRTVTLNTDTLTVARNTVRNLILVVELSGAAPTGSIFTARLVPGGTHTLTLTSRVQDRFVVEDVIASGDATTTVLRAGELFALSENPVRRDSVILNFAERPTVAAVYTVTGARVADLLPRFDGLHYRWDLTNDAGERVVPGVYLLVFRVGDRLIRERLMVLSPRIGGS